MAVDIMSSIILSLVGILIGLPIGALFLKLTAKIFKLNDKSYGTAFKISLILGIVSILLLSVLALISFNLTILVYLVSIPLALWLVKTNYDISWAKSLGVFVVWGIFSGIFAFILSIILTLVGVGILFSQV